MKINSTNILLVFYMNALIFCFPGCKKQNDWLEVKRLRNDVTPQTVKDYQAILDNSNQINDRFVNIGLIGTDNLFLKESNLGSIQQLEKDGYLWKASMWDNQNGTSSEWNNQFAIIEYANIVLDGLLRIDANTPGLKNLEGQALFLRAFAYYNLSLLFCAPWGPSTAHSPGLPIRLNSDVSITYPRSSLQETYDQMIADIKQAIELLDSEPLYTRRAGKFAALALAAKIYLTKEDYSMALNYAGLVLNQKNTLLDFNNSSLVNTSKTYRFPVNGTDNPEILFYASCNTWNSLRPATSNTSFVDRKLYDLYDPNDLRKSMFFVNSGTDRKYRGSYTGATGNFCGIALNEVILIRAECNARLNNNTLATEDINTLLSKRFKTGTYTPKAAGNSDQTLLLVLQERRKELPFVGGLRWEDLRRLNRDTRFQVTITRTLNGQEFTLPPNSKAYVLPIPGREIELTGISQNER